MSADTHRPIWLDARLAGAIAYAKARSEADWQDIAHEAELGEILAAWDAAPANPTEAVAKALRDTPKCGYWRNSEEGADAVLRALGHKAAS